MKAHRVIAIDGPAASGKSSVARRLAAELGYGCVDSGALYRAVAWAVLARNRDPADPAQVEETVCSLEVTVSVRDGNVRFLIDGEWPGDALRTQRVDACVSEVAAVPEVRRRVRGWLRQAAKTGPVVMEGRDIGTAVFPDADFKVYLDASPGERARRRHAEGRVPGGESALAEVARAIRNRDRLDAARSADPLRVADDAWVMDTTGIGLDEVVARIADRLPEGEKGP